MGQTMFTLNARGSILLEVIQRHFDLSPSQMFREINASFVSLLDALRLKAIDYASLRSALVPSTNKNEAAFVFDSMKISSAWYGYEVFERLLPGLDSRGVHSVLCGDCIDTERIRDSFYSELMGHIKLQRPVDWHSGDQFFVVYINNLSNRMIQRLRGVLAPYEGYVGFLDCSSPSFLKTYLSLILCNSFLKAGKTIIQGHEDDRDNTEDVNMLGYPFERFDYVCRSLQSMYYDLFLSYKIERAVYSGFESDMLFSLNSISATVVPLGDCTVQIEPRKLKYLVERKPGSMKRAGLVSLTKDKVEQEIQERLASNYVFNMHFAEAYNVMKFNTILNFPATNGGRLVKLLASLEYKPLERTVRLITLF
jgi:hypothetical protein